MNTGGLLWGGEEHSHGTIYATLLCGAASSRHSWRCAGSGCSDGYMMGFAAELRRHGQVLAVFTSSAHEFSGIWTGGSPP
jgi:hypothetical protein